MRKFLLSMLLLMAVCLTGCVHYLPEEDAPGLPATTTGRDSGESTTDSVTTDSGSVSGEESSQAPAFTDDGYTKPY